MNKYSGLFETLSFCRYSFINYYMQHHCEVEIKLDLVNNISGNYVTMFETKWLFKI